MQNQFPQAVKCNLETQEFEPYFEDGHRLGDVHWIRREIVDGQPKTVIGIMKATADQLPEAFEYTWALDEVIQVLEGSLVVEIKGGETLGLLPGDVASFKKGGTAVFKAKGPYKQFFVMTA